MATAKTLQRHLNPAYQSVDLQLRISRNRIACMLGVILMPIGGLLDHLLYPQLLKEFIIIRMVVVLLLALIFLSHYTEFGKKHIKWLGIIMIITLNASFCIMMYLSTGVLSRYHSALSVMIISSGILLPWTVEETLLVSVITLCMYFSSCILHGMYYTSVMAWDTLMNNSYFILLSGIIAATSSYFNTRARINDFELRQELNSRNKELEELDRLKSRFFANISHELRTPLTLILAPIQDLLQSSEDFDHKTNSLLSTAHNNALRLLRLVNELLEVIKLEEGKMEYDGEPIDIDDFLAAMIDSMRHLSESNQITLSKNLLPGPHIIIADSYMLERIFINLISNAIKFTQAGGSIIISNEIVNNGVVIKVTDTGIGINEDDLPYIFDRFHQAGNSSTHRSQGTGLGLALVKELIEIMHGDISVTSKLGSGTTMQITFPLSEQEIPVNTDNTKRHNEDINTNIQTVTSKEAGLIKMPAKPVSVTIDEIPEGEGPLILVVDDEPDMRSYLVASLEKTYRVIQAQDGEQALNIATKHKPDFILLDLMLPKIDGLQVCRTLKHDNETKHIKIMLLTARIDEEAKISALKNGADDFLTKPFSKMEVQTRLRNMLQTAELEKSLKIHNTELKNTLSALKQTQSQLLHSEKINALGKLTAGLLHEINNPLNYALTALQIIKREPIFKDDEVLNETFQDIDEGMNRIKTIISELQVFAHPSEDSKHETFHLQDAITSTLRFTANELGDITVVQNLQQDDNVIGSRGSIVQVLINLIGNACKAINAVKEQRKGEILIKTQQKNDRLYVYVRDNGTGIEEDFMANIFDPFYTSRDVGEGMGLGLSICHTIVKNHGGRLSVRSEVGKWTEFSFDLPLAAESVEKEEFNLQAAK